MTVPRETETVREAHPPFVPFPREAVEGSLVARFRTRVAAWPDRPAVRAGGVTVSYRELAERAAGVARDDRPRRRVARDVPQRIRQRECQVVIDGVESVRSVQRIIATYPPCDRSRRPALPAPE